MESKKLTGPELVAYVHEHNCTTKQAILKQLDKKIQNYAEKLDSGIDQVDSFNTLLAVHLKALKDKIDNAVLFDPLPDEWAYYLEYEYDNLSLNIEHVYMVELTPDGDYMATRCNATYELISVKPESLSVESYCHFYNVEQGTVRQWIRRGKIRTAYKEGSEWLIPMLTPTPSRGYEPAQYKWISGLQKSALPEEYKFLADYVLATFYQDRNDRSKYHVLFVAKETFVGDGAGSGKNKELILSAQQREKLELYMISHPLIKYCGIVI